MNIDMDEYVRPELKGIGGREAKIEREEEGKGERREGGEREEEGEGGAPRGPPPGLTLMSGS